MKLQLIFCLLMFYVFLIQADQNQHPISITINAQTQSGLEQQNDVDQTVRHTSLPITHVETGIDRTAKEESTSVKQELTQTVTGTNWVLRNSLKGYGIMLMAGIAGPVSPWLLPTYVGCRLVYAACSDTPWMDRPTQQEAEELAAQGKVKLPEPIFYPVAHHIYKYGEKIYKERTK